MLRKRKKKREREETNYQMVLEDWEKRMNGKIPNKPPRQKLCTQPNYHYSRKSELEERTEFIMEHPLGEHWHYPELIRKDDFHEFYELNKENKIGEKILYYYQAKRD